MTFIAKIKAPLTDYYIKFWAVNLTEAYTQMRSRFKARKIEIRRIKK